MVLSNNRSVNLCIFKPIKDILITFCHLHNHNLVPVFPIFFCFVCIKSIYVKKKPLSVACFMF